MGLFLKRFTGAYKRGLGKEDQLRFLNQLHRLLNNGYPIVDALYLLSLNKQFHSPATKISDALKNGKTIDNAFEEAAFHPTIVSFLYFIKISGDLMGNIEKCKMFFHQQITYTKKFLQVIRYPFILFVFFCILLLIIRSYVLPSFQQLFQGQANTIFSIHFSYLVIDFLTTLFIGIFSLLTLFLFFWRKIQNLFSIEEKIKFYEKLPLLRSLITITTSYYFATHFSSLLKAGLPVNEILTNMSKQKKLPIVAYYCNVMIEELSKGIDLSYIIQQFRLFDKKLTILFQKHTDYSSLQKDLSTYAELLMDEIENKMMKFLTLVQPIVLIIIALFIIFMYATIMWPLFQVIKTL